MEEIEQEPYFAHISPRDHWRRLATMLAAFLLGLLLLEGLARMVLPEPRIGEWFRWDPDVRSIYLPNHEYPLLQIEKEFFPGLKTDERSLRRAQDNVVPPGAREYRVMIIGDSTANMAHIDGFPEQLQQHLNQVLPADQAVVHVQNAGVAGFSTRDMMKLARREIPYYKPDLVLFCPGINDAVMVLTTDREMESTYDIYFLMAHYGQWSLLVRSLRARIPEGLAIDRNLNRGHLPAERSKPRVYPEETLEHLRTVREHASASGAEFGVVLKAWMYWRPQDRWDQVPSYDPIAYRKPLLEYLTTEGIPFIDEAVLLDRGDRIAFFHAIEDAEKPGQYLIDNTHLNLPGNDLIASALVPLVLECLGDVQWNTEALLEHLRALRETPVPTWDPRNLVAPKNARAALGPHMIRSNAYSTLETGVRPGREDETLQNPRNYPSYLVSGGAKTAE